MLKQTDIPSLESNVGMKHAAAYGQRTAALLWVLLAGCADNAVLELNVTYPARPGEFGELYVRPLAAKASFGPYNTMWSTQDRPRSATLSASDRSSQLPISIVADGEVTESGTEDVVVKFRFCTTSDCEARPGMTLDPVVAEIWYEFGTPFYLGKQTQFDVALSGVPSCQTCEADSDCLNTPACPADPEGNDVRCFCRSAGTGPNICMLDRPPTATVSFEAVCAPTAPPDSIDRSTCEPAPYQGTKPAWLCRVPKCRVGGCFSGLSNYCYPGTDRHYCEGDP